MNSALLQMETNPGGKRKQYWTNQTKAQMHENLSVYFHLCPDEGLKWLLWIVYY